MSTLLEIESAVADLPPQEQRSLLEWLHRHLLSKRTPSVAGSSDRTEWLAELAELYAAAPTPTSRASPVQQVMDDLREERAG